LWSCRSRRTEEDLGVRGCPARRPRPKSDGSPDRTETRMACRTVLIAGAGIAGPVLAYGLDRCGMEPTVMERAAEPRRGGQNVDVRGPGRVVAARCGIEEAVRGAGTGERGLAFVDATGAVQAEFPATTGDEAAEGGDGPTAELEILRGDLAQILYERTRHRVPYRFGNRITALEDDGRRVRVGFEHDREEEFDLVIAADGLNSSTREIAFPGQVDVRYLGLCLAYFAIAREDTDTDWWRWYAAGAGRTISLRPDRHGTMRAQQLPLRARPDGSGRAAGVAVRGVRRGRLGGRTGAPRDGPGTGLLLRGDQPGPCPVVRQRPRGARR